MAVKIRNSVDSVTAGELDEVERRLGIDLPADYRDSLLRQNGGIPEPGWFDYPPLSPDFDAGGSAQVLLLYSVLLPLPTEYDLRDIEATARFQWDELGLPHEYLPIGMTGDDIIVLGVAGADRGKVYFWSHMSGGFEGSFFVPLASTFEAFLSGLRERRSDQAEQERCT
jgi:SMI1 / KNR4 family (SUKH-1)